MGGSIYAIERLAQLTIQALLDLGAMLAVELKDEKPETYRGIADYISNKLGLGEDLRRFLRGGSPVLGMCWFMGMPRSTGNLRRRPLGIWRRGYP